MCSITGVISKDDDPSSSRSTDRLLLTMTKILKHRGQDMSGIMLDDDVIYFKNFNELEYENKNKNMGNSKFNSNHRVSLGHNRLAIVGEAVQPLPNCDETIWIVCNGEVYNYVELNDDLCEKHCFKTDTDTEVILHAYEDHIEDRLDGDFAYAIYDKEKNIVVLRRDLMGVKPLYYTDLENHFIFASEKKALYYILMELENYTYEEAFNSELIKRLNPNSELIYHLDNNEIIIQENLEEIITEYYNYNFNTVNYDYNYCRNELNNVITESVSKRVRGLEKVGIIYSGGVDSTLIAKLASENCNNVILYTVGVEGSEDVYYAEKAAKDLNLKLRKKTLTENDFEKYLLNVANAIDELNVMKLGVGIPIYAASEMAKEDGIKVVLSGQGADELFAGYNRYKRTLTEKGKEGLEKELYDDSMNIYKVNLERDDHCTMANGVELRVPFLDKNVVNVALSMPVEYKITKDEDAENSKNEHWKRILRDVARKHVPEYIADRPKKAAQYGSGSEKTIYKVARNHGYSKKNIENFLKDYVFKKMEANLLPYVIPNNKKFDKSEITINEIKYA
ncbi:asparagine synthase (glutamine-hydrolyzing) [Methanococcus voltae]|uniref:Putative asparagine synthetase [glutamine-hydrolyzing] n=1 Tax=Methanococcus voltae (strain ATCC BAA-1334 / A3) TaxID=456320 RepID=D7DTY7_METV3|nr:asparagine synthase (glutamine-hydrolyzing) [Methanococcus voltae]MCS3900397.1 asparagine synthase (glutamine-hydrolyzing) [Methanococcus voltae]